MTAQSTTRGNTNLKPMKGAFLVLNEDVLAFIQEAMEEITGVYSDDKADQAPQDVYKTLSEREGWTTVKDKFGRKVYKFTPYYTGSSGHDQGELRVTVVMRPDDTFNLDIRVWGQY